MEDPKTSDFKVEEAPVVKKEPELDKEERFELLYTFVRMGILIWSGCILTLNYVTIPKLPQDKIDPTFIASVFTGTLATFGVQRATKDSKKE